MPPFRLFHPWTFAPDTGGEGAAPAADSAPAASPAPDGGSTPAPQDTAPAAAAGTPDSQAAAGAQDSGPTSLLDAVRAVVQDNKDGQDTGTPSGEEQPAGDDRTSAPSAAAPAAGEQGAAGAAGEEPDLTEADLADIQKPHIRKRIAKAIAQRNQAREQLAEFQPDAERWRQHTQFLAENHVSPEDSLLLYGVASALARGEYKTFLDAVQPYVEAAQTALGIRLPADIQRQVDDGLLPEDTARELARARAEAETANAQATRATQQTQAIVQQQTAAQLRGAVAEWEATVRQNDPDFAHKQDAIARIASGLVASRGLPRTPKEAVAMAQEAYDEVSKLTARFRPAPQPTRSSPASVHTPNSGTPEPRNLLEAIQMGLRQAASA